MSVLMFCLNRLHDVRVAMILIFFLVQPQASSATGEDTNPGERIIKEGNVTIGGLFPVHVRGEFRSKFMGLAEAMVFAIEQINNDSNLLPNITLGYDISDTNLENRRAMKSTLDFVNVHKFAFANPQLNETCLILPRGKFSPVVAVVGTGTSRSSILVSNLLEVEDIPLISYAATSDELSSSAYPSFFRTVPPDRFQSKVMSDIARNFNWTYVAAIAVDDAYGRSGIEFFRKNSKPLGICIAYETYFPSNGQRGEEKIRTIIEELKERDEIGVIILYCTSDPAVSVLTEALRQGLIGRTWIASEAWGNNDRVIKRTDLQPILQGMLGVVFTDITVPSYKRYLLSRTSAYRPEPWWKHFWEREFSCSFNATPSNGTEQCLDHFKITESIYEKSLADSKSTYVINAVYAIAHALDAIFRCVSSPKNQCPKTEPYVEPLDVLQYLKKVNFTSEVSNVFFDENGDSQASYSIINYRAENGTNGRVETVGTWEVGSLQLNASFIMWNKGLKGTKIPRSVCSERCHPGYRQTQELNCCWQCIRCLQDTISSVFGAMNCTPCSEDHISNEARTECMHVPVERIQWGDSLGVFITFFAVSGTLASILIGGVFVWRNETPIVKASNRELSYTFLFSICMNYIWALINLAEPTDFVCPLQQAWFYIFYTVAILVLGVKTKRIVHLFENRVPRSELTQSFVQRHKHILILVGVVALVVFILIIWFVDDIPRPNVDKSIRTPHYLECLASSSVLGKVCQYLLIAILVSVSIVCCYFAFKSRKLPHNFNEGKFIAFALYTSVISWVTFYPVYLNIRGKYSVVIAGAASIIAASGLLVCIFVPKVYIIIFQPEKNTVAYMKSQISSHTFRRSAMDAESRHRSCNSPESNPAAGTPTGTPVQSETPTSSRLDIIGPKMKEVENQKAVSAL